MLPPLQGGPMVRAECRAGACSRYTEAMPIDAEGVRGACQFALAAIEQGKRVTVDLINHSLVIDGEALIDNGRWAGELGVDPTDEATALTMIEQAYIAYERSVPLHDGRDNSRWFYAHPIDELTDQELVTGEERPVARARLEVITLALILNGSLTRSSQQMQGKWFWQSPNHPRLVILTDWLQSP